MDIYAARRELKLGLKKIQDLHLRVVHYDRVSTEKEEQKSSIVNQNYYSEYYNDHIMTTKLFY